MNTAFDERVRRLNISMDIPERYKLLESEHQLREDLDGLLLLNSPTFFFNVFIEVTIWAELKDYIVVL